MRGRCDEWHLDLDNSFGHLAFHLSAGLGQPAVVIAPPLFHPRLVPIRAVTDPVRGDGVEQVVVQAQPAGGVLRGSELQQGLERSQGLHRPREAQRPRCDAVFGRGLGHHGAEEVVGQDVRPHFLPHQLRRLVPQLPHLHRRLERAYIQLTEQRVTKLGQFTDAHFDKFRAARLVDHHPKTVYCESVIVKQLMKWARKRKLIRENPLAEYEVEKPRTKKGLPSLNQVKRILATLAGPRYAQISILAFTGMRAGELQRLKPEDIDLVDRWVHVRRPSGGETKNRQSRKVPIDDRCCPCCRA